MTPELVAFQDLTKHLQFLVECAGRCPFRLASPSDALESQVRRRRNELIQIICHDYPETAEKLLLHDLPAPKVEANGDAPSKSPELTRKLERGARCARILDEVKEFKYLRVDVGMTVAEIQEKNPGFVVWKLRERVVSRQRNLGSSPGFLRLSCRRQPLGI